MVKHRNADELRKINDDFQKVKFFLDRFDLIVTKLRYILTYMQIVIVGFLSKLFLKCIHVQMYVEMKMT